MSDRLALILGAVVIAAILIDVFANSGGALLFLGRKFADMVEYLAFWR
ncbi:MAG: hypothetical protein WCC57_02950 [Paracoccaceae bacterium]